MQNAGEACEGKRNKNDAADAEAIARRFAGRRCDLCGRSRPSNRVG